jgi:sensor domain CHASE-containing protein
MTKLSDKEIQEYIGCIKQSIEKHENRIRTSVEALVNKKIELIKYVELVEMNQKIEGYKYEK